MAQAQMQSPVQVTREASHSNVQSAAATIVDEHRVPIIGMQALAGAEAAKKDAVQSEVVEIRQQIKGLYSEEIAEVGEKSLKWLKGSLEIFTTHSQEAVKAALKGRTRAKGEKQSTEDVQLIYVRTLFNGWLSLGTMFAPLTQKADGTPLRRDLILTNIRDALKSKRDAERDEQMITEISKTLKAAGIPEDTIKAKADEILEQRKANDLAEAEALITPEMRGQKAAAQLVKQYTNADTGLVGWEAINAFLVSMQDALHEIETAPAVG